MGMVFTNACENLFLNYICTPTYEIGLYTNNYDPTPTTVLGNLSEVSDMSYSRANSFFSGPTTVDGKSVNSMTGPTFSFSPDDLRSPFTVYGYFFYDGGSSVLICAEKLATPVTIDSSGGSVSLPNPLKWRLYNP